MLIGNQRLLGSRFWRPGVIKLRWRISFVVNPFVQADLKGKRIVLKPNLVEFDPKGVINTHPAVIEAAIGSFRSLGAREVVVAEDPATVVTVSTS
jgi:uncharacterized protein (DUF362 family)